MAVTHPVTNTNDCELTSSSDHTTIYPLGNYYLNKDMQLDAYRYTDSKLLYFEFSFCAKHL